MIPKKIHYIFGLDVNFANKPFSLINYLCIKSAHDLNPSFEIMMYYVNEPANNIWWEKIKPFCKLVRWNDEYQEIGGQVVKYTEHIGDVRRLNVLNSIGGIYLDVDVVCLKPFDELLDNQVVMGIEKFNGLTVGLCNAVILSEKNTSFINKWIDSYFSEFDPNDWNKMSVRKPYTLAALNPSEITIQPHCSFFRYNWHELVDLFAYHEYFFPDLDRSYCLHLYQSKWHDFALRHITEEDILTRKCEINTILKKILCTK